MSDDRPPDGSDDKSDRADDDDDDEKPESSGFRLEAGLRPLSDVLGGLFEVTVTDAPPPTETTDRSSADDETARRFGDDSRRSADRDRTDRPRKKRRRTAPSEAYLIDTRREDGEFVVTVDIPGADRDDLSIGLDPRTNELVIGVRGTVLERVDPPWRSVEATRASFNNGVLEVRLRPAEE